LKTVADRPEEMVRLAKVEHKAAVEASFRRAVMFWRRS